MTRNAELKTKLMHTTEPCFTLAQLATLRLKILKTSSKLRSFGRKKRDESNTFSQVVVRESCFPCLHDYLLIIRREKNDV